MKTYILLFGVTGDLSKRMLLPSLENLLKTKKISNLYIYGVSRRQIDINELLKTSFGDNYKKTNISKKIEAIVLDENFDDYLKLKNKIKLNSKDQLLIYLSVPPTNALKYVELLGKAKFNTKNIKLLLEKPFGTDYKSAKDFLTIIDKYYDEKQVYKIDHYLAKANAQALINDYRKSKDLIKIWNNENIKFIDVCAYENIDVQGRTVFYEQTGALRDFIQGHLIELLLLTICPITSNIVQSRIECIKQLKLNINESIRGQYIGYSDEVGSTTNVETYASVVLKSNNAKWKNVDFNLKTGKALASKQSFIKVSFKNGSTIQFNISPSNLNQFEITLFNNDEILPKNNKQKYLDGYNAVFYAAINSNKTLFTSNNEILYS
jgi:glucose-6-phosphate 1-dehydrogenase